ncbi:hypothetical protein AB833_23335 [Chromatiales bacterium (ex Bugula neritina AB1)]|nr:hypothetical protein AB833_23335 [Chromatiales bacterium (ex Bugula neritina AB1)]
MAAREADLDRANLYSSLGALLAAPASKEHCEALRELPLIEEPDTALGIAWVLLKSAAESYSLEQINDEYHDLFIGVGRGIVVPYGSWHITGFLMEKPLGALRADLRALGFERVEGVKESEDHIASLCQAMAAIITAEDISFDTEKSFFNEHISVWADSFFNEVLQTERAGFYRAVAELGKGFVELEKQYLKMSV